MSSSDEGARSQSSTTRRLRSKRLYHSSSDDSAANPARKTAGRVPVTRSRISSRSSSEEEGSSSRRERRSKRNQEKNPRNAERSLRKHSRSSSFVFDHPMVQHARTSSYAMYQQSVGIVLIIDSFWRDSDHLGSLAFDLFYLITDNQDTIKSNQIYWRSVRCSYD